MAPRQVSPMATLTPTASGAMIPQPAAIALASLIAAAPRRPWWSDRTGLTELRQVAPPMPAISAPAA